MMKKSNNFTFFSTPKKSNYPKVWQQQNKNEFAEHPELGILAFNAPDKDLVEDLSKRNIDYRYFINPNQPSEFYVQKSLGDLHYKKDGYWQTINHYLTQKGNHLFEADRQPEPVGFNAKDKFSYINTPNGKISFNQWKLYGKNQNNTIELIALANWDNFTAGDDGLYISNIFPGIDASMKVMRGAVKTNFIVKSIQFSNYSEYIFQDELALGNEIGILQFMNVSNTEHAVDRVQFIANNISIVEIGEALAYPENGDKSQRYFPEYNISNNQLGIIISATWLQQMLQLGHVIIDPLVTSTNTLAQAAITGSRYDATCNFTQSCDFTLNVNTPPAAVFTDVLINFDYLAQGLCFMEDGATRFTLGGCVSPNLAGFYWYCQDPNPGTCTGTNISIFSDISTCLPAPSCLAQPLSFGLKFYRSCWGTTGAACSNTCIGAASPWNVVIQGQTVNFTNPAPNQFSVSATSVCAGQNITATSLGTQYGVGPYTVNWSLSPTGIPSVGAGTPAVINFPTAGAYTLYCIITDACGSTSSANKAINITPPPAAPTVTSPISYCQNTSASILTATGSNLEWFTVPVGGTPTGAPTPATGVPGTTSYYVQQTVGGCVSPRAQIDVIINAFPTFGGGASATPASCGASDGAITGLTVSGSGTITYNWYNNVPTLVSTSTLNANLSNQPAGNYSLTAIDANGCSNTYGPVVITSSAPPAGPTVSSPIIYCQGATATALTATGSNLLWYTVPVGGIGSAIAPTPSTAVVGTTSYYVSQTISGCESARIQIDVTINNAPAAPTVSTPLNLCQGATTSALTATGVSLLWYTVPVGGVGTSTAPTPSSAVVGSTNYYVSQTSGGCESPRALIVVQVNAAPVISGAPLVTQSTCGQNNGAITGYGSAPITGIPTYTWTNAANIVVSTSSATSDLTNQPAGTYTLTLTDGLGCSSSAAPVQITSVGAPAAPLVTTPVNYCEGANASQLTATGTSILWYTVPVGGTGAATAPTPSTTVAGTFSYYVSQTIAGCESALAQIDIIVTATPAAPVVTSPVSYCQGIPTGALTASGVGVLWYTVPTGGTGSSTNPVPSSAVSGSTSYYATQTIGGCESPTATIVVQINETPVISGTPVVSPSNCGASDGSITGINVSGSGTLTYTWTDASLAVVSTSNTSPDLLNQPSGSYTLLVTTALGCSAQSTTLQITNSSGPSAPVVNTPVQYCINAPSLPLTATGTNLLWYTVPVGGIGSSTAPTPVTSTTGTVSYYVSQTVAGCESALAQIDVTVTPPPAAPLVVSPVNLCLNSVANSLTAPGTNLLWYNVPVGGTGSSTAPIPSTITLGTTSYYVSEVNSGCESARAQIDVIVNPLPASPTVNSPISYCQGAVATPLTATGTGLLYYTALTGGIGLSSLTPQTSIAGDTSYYVSQTIGACESPRAEIIVIINPSVIPTAVITSSNTDVCAGTLISFSAIVNNAGASPTFQWLLNNNPIPGETNLNYSSNTLTGNGQITFQVNSTALCANPTQAISNVISLNITPNATPSVSLFSEPDVICSGKPVNMKATALFGGANPNFIFRVNGVVVQDSNSNIYSSSDLQNGDMVVVILQSNYPCISGSNTVNSNTVVIEVAPPPTVDATVTLDTIINGQSTLLTAVTGSNNATFLWEPATHLVCDICQSTEANPPVSTNYILTVTDVNTGCSAIDTINVYVTNEFNIFLPTAFSPNLNGTNDDLFLRGTGIKSFTLDVFDRWGLKVFTTSDQNVGWDGTHNDKPVLAGVYAYYLKYEKFDGTFGELKGNINLIR
ncbi:MAG TPA: gliding motility-associated C-terminal domain-containing protein [Bacteroidia bacterium]|nr:gliding motility-associated C-terminal domain-containing protein [Bacteroidia bacterium]